MSNKWKASLLKSSLPLEQMTAELICKNNFHIGGEFAYSKMNNEGKYVDFSVDLLASKMKEHRSDIKVWSDLNLLVECKYSSPNIQWIFSTYPKLEPMCASTVQTYESALPVISIKTPLNKLEKDAFYGINGFALTDTSFDNKRIRHGLNQLRNAIPSLVKKLILYEVGDDSGQMILPLICPILVTNAPLRLLKKGITIEQIENAKDLDEVSDTHNIIYHFQEVGVNLKSYIK